MQDAFNKSRSNRKLLVLSLLAASLSACGGGYNDLPPLKQTIIPSLDPVGRVQVISGWLPDYDAHIQERVSRNFPDLLSLAPSRLAVVCPRWDRLDRGQREKFWSAVVWSIAGPESGRNRTVVFRETAMSIDAVTGKQIRSEGLLQLSYVDVRNHRYEAGDVSWEQDRAMALSDYAKGVKFGNPLRTILNAYPNLNLGLFIMNRLLTKSFPSLSFEDALGKYWHVMQDTSSSFKGKVIPNLRSRMPACFG